MQLCFAGQPMDGSNLMIDMDEAMMRNRNAHICIRKFTQ